MTSPTTMVFVIDDDEYVRKSLEGSVPYIRRRSARSTPLSRLLRANFIAVLRFGLYKRPSVNKIVQTYAPKDHRRNLGTD